MRKLIIPLLIGFLLILRKPLSRVPRCNSYLGLGIVLILTFFAQDAWTWRDNWTFNLGLRWETQTQTYMNESGGQSPAYELDNLLGLNFLLEQSLGGGGTVSLMLDPQGKTLSHALLEMVVDAPENIIPRPGG